MAILSPKNRFLLIAHFYTHPIVSISEIKLAELFGLPQLIEQLTNQWQQILIFDCEFIESLIVDTHAKPTIRHIYKQN